MLPASNNKALELAACGLSLCLATAMYAQEATGQQRRLPTRVRVTQKVMELFIVKKVPPEYPKEARQKRIQGTVVLQGIISREGDVAEISVVSGDPMLTPAAIEAVKQWKYKPYLLNGQPVEVETQLQLNFTLSGN
jgi:periplasmic protein TonB